MLCTEALFVIYVAPPHARSGVFSDVLHGGLAKLRKILQEGLKRTGDTAVMELWQVLVLGLLREIS
jgi:hypothetical protein